MDENEHEKLSNITLSHKIPYFSLKTLLISRRNQKVSYLRVQLMCDERSFIHRYSNEIVSKSGSICHQKYCRPCVLYIVATCICTKVLQTLCPLYSGDLYMYKSIVDPLSFIQWRLVYVQKYCRPFVLYIVATCICTKVLQTLCPLYSGDLYMYKKQNKISYFNAEIVVK